ncbi:MAG TPA: acetyltransferase [Nitrospiria bacterium]|nr:acetyltransferase [Candidatus Manganitrophaceae bacterium]
MSRLLIAGAGGHGCVVADTSEMTARWERIAFLDDRFSELSELAHWPVVGRLSDANGLQGEYKDIVVAIGDCGVRVKWLERYGKAGFGRPVIVHPRAYVSSHAALSAGTVVFAQAAVNFGARIGLGCIVNTGAVIEHDCSIGEGTHICPGVRLAGEVSIGLYSWIGIGAVVREGVTIGNNVVVGAGAVVVKDLPDGVRAIGVPARPV